MPWTRYDRFLASMADRVPTPMQKWMRRLLPIAWLVILYLPFTWLMDRKPPYQVVQYIQPSPVKAGDTVTFIMPVHRDVKRNCAVTYSRHLRDQQGARYDINGLQTMSSESVEELEASLGSWQKLSVLVPKTVAPGAVFLVTELQYQCNPIHAIWPIEMTLFYPFVVLPPDADTN